MCRLLQAAEAEVEALQKEGLVDECVPVGGSGPGALRPAFFRLLEQLSLRYPQAIPMAKVWGYGRPSWDVAARQYGQKPFRQAWNPDLFAAVLPCLSQSA